MTELIRPTNKAELLALMQASYNEFKAFLTTLRPEQMTIPGVNGCWSVKDNIAHLAICQSYQAARMQGVLDGIEPPNLAPGREERDDINEYLYHQYKNRPLAHVLEDFHSSYQLVLAATEMLSWEALNQPFPWYNNKIPVGAHIIGNTAGHYAAHREIIECWLKIYV